MTHIFTKLFNLILLSKKTPDEWSIGMIKPVFKNKGSFDEPGNYRGITLLSCFGKLFTSILNERLIQLLDSSSYIGPERAGFRAGFSTTDHIFTLHCIIDFFLAKKKRLYCLFLDYKKAFDLVNRASLWNKLIGAGLHGRILDLIKDMYGKAKSCVKLGNFCSDYFHCFTGVRQGENLSPLLFALYLNDLQTYISENMDGLSTLRQEAREMSLDADDENTLYKMFVLLYADDTVICAESADGIQKALDSMAQYCDKWSLKVNVSKTKIMVFSRGKIRNLPVLSYKNQNLGVVFGFQYLGIHFNFNNKFNVAQKQLYDKASRAMFALLKNCKKLMLPPDVQIELFNRMITPILLYGCEVWCPTMTDLASKLHLRFLKIMFKLKKSTPSVMVYGEFGQFPLEIEAKCRMLNYWFTLSDPSKHCKFSNTIYRFLLKAYVSNVYKSPFLTFVHNTLNSLGFSGDWIGQFENRCTAASFKTKIKQRLKDQYIQGWFSDLDSKDICYNYKLFKTKFVFEEYISLLPENLAQVVMRFRIVNNNLPVQKGRHQNIPREERICTKCDGAELGDEFHYVFKCPHFLNFRKQYIPKYYGKAPNVIKFAELFQCRKRLTLKKLALFLRLIMKEL